jgi:Tol biopolymer transport system component
MRAVITPSVVATVACLAGGLAVWPAPAPAAERGQDRFVSNVRQLTFEGRRSGECYFSADSTKLVFMSEREPGNPFFQIYMLDFETGDVTRISTGCGKTTCPYFQYTTGLIEYASTHLDPDFEQQCQAEYKRREEGRREHGSWDYDEHYDIFVAKPDGTIIKRLTYADGYDAEGAYSPDGSKIVFCSLRDAYPLYQLSPEQRAQFDRDASYFGEIYIMDADGSNQKRLTDWPGYDGGPFFTFDGQRIVWRHFEENGLLADVYTMKIDGTDVRRLTDFKSMSWAPYFHPSGEYCIFNTNKHGFHNFELYIVDAMGEREPVRVTYTEGFDALAAFSPDGKKICWTSNVTDTGMSQLFMADWDHQAARTALTESPLRVRVEGATAAGNAGRQ